MEQLIIKLERQGTDLVTNQEEFAVALKTWRVRNGLTQAELAAKAGLSRYTIMRVEKASRLADWKTLYKLFNLIADKQ